MCYNSFFCPNSQYSPKKAHFFLRIIFEVLSLAPKIAAKLSADIGKVFAVETATTFSYTNFVFKTVGGLSGAYNCLVTGSNSINCHELGVEYDP
jgi:hypothetical protein